MINSFYCPKCGEYTDNPFPVTLLPGFTMYSCSLCSTKWEIKMEFIEEDIVEFIEDISNEN